MNLNNRRISKLLVKAHKVPAIPKRIRDGTSTFFLPLLSARIPNIGVNIMPGTVNTVINKPISTFDTLNTLAISGKTGEMLETLNIAVRVTQNTIKRFLSLYSLILSFLSDPSIFNQPPRLFIMFIGLSSYRYYKKIFEYRKL